MFQVSQAWPHRSLDRAEQSNDFTIVDSLPVETNYRLRHRHGDITDIPQVVSESVDSMDSV